MAQIMMFMETHPYIMDTDVREWRCVSLALTSLIPWKTNQIPRRWSFGVSFSCLIAACLYGGKMSTITDWITACVSALCMFGSLYAYLKAQKEKKAAKESEEKAKEYADLGIKYYRTQMLSRLQDIIIHDINTHNHSICHLTAEQIVEQNAGYSIGDAELVLECLEKQGLLICEDITTLPKEYVYNNSAFKLGQEINNGSFSF